MFACRSSSDIPGDIGIAIPFLKGREVWPLLGLSPVVVALLLTAVFFETCSSCFVSAACCVLGGFRSLAVVGLVASRVVHDGETMVQLGVTDGEKQESRC